MTRAWEQSIKAGDLEAVRSQLEQGVDVNARNRYGQTAIMIASTAGNAALVDLLISLGADLNATAKYHLSALMLAVINRHQDIVALLCNAGADLGILGSGAYSFFDLTALDL